MYYICAYIRIVNLISNQVVKINGMCYNIYSKYNTNEDGIITLSIHRLKRREACNCSVVSNGEEPPTFNPKEMIKKVMG